jgi:hypothetical protein
VGFRASGRPDFHTPLPSVRHVAQITKASPSPGVGNPKTCTGTASQAEPLASGNAGGTSEVVQVVGVGQRLPGCYPLLIGLSGCWGWSGGRWIGVVAGLPLWVAGWGAGGFIDQSNIGV